ncbi:UNVERIFIED_CONTAM: hypothetical protein RMT77_000666 [Armadillidium vulgare]
MKLWQCDWVPSSVADWLCRELDDRGIPGTTYTHTLLSLLHPYFCPHPVPKDPSHLPKSFINFECVRSILSTSQPQKELEVLFEELEDHVHPDADFPELKIFENPKEKTRRSKKRQKRKLNQISLSPERIWKVAALQCLWTASDKPEDIEGIIEELFFRLNNNSGSTKEPKDTNLSYLEENQTEFLEVNFSDSCSTTDFPPLPESKEEENHCGKIENTLDWKTVIKDKLSPKKENDSSTKEESHQLNLVNDSNTGNVSQPLDIASCDHLEKDKLEMEIKVENGERGELKNDAYCFMPIFREEPKFFDSEMQCSNFEVNVDVNVLQDSHPKEEEVIATDGNGKMEEWECAGQLLAEPINRAVSVDVLGNRLYERSAVTSDVTRSISNTGLNNTTEDHLNHQCAQEENVPSSVWSFSSESWKKPQIENLWNSSAFPSQAFDNKTTLNNDNLNSVLSVSMHKNNQLNFIDEDRIDNIHPEKEISEHWPPSPWNTFPNAVKSKKQIFFSAQPAINEETNRSADNFKSLAVDIGNESIKTIWSDYNDNITNVNLTTRVETNLSRSASLIGLLEEEKNEENLCRSFNQLGLEHLWEDVLQTENKVEKTYLSKNFQSESPSLIDANLLEEQTLPAEDAFKMRYTKEKDDDSYFIPKIPCGPSGPYVELRHTESSGFSAVVPHDKNITPSENSSLNEEAIDLIPKESNEIVMDTHLTTSEEENLLTSPRTHFRPIRQDSHGSVEDSKSEDSQGNSNILGNVQDSDLVFQRSGSGTLYLESDLLKGSPKKYMAYREPAKIQTLISAAELPSCPVITQPEDNLPNVFVPKFKLINNEKFCQTEGPEGSENLHETILKETESQALQNDLKEFDFLFKDNKNWDESYKTNIKVLWEQNNESNKEAWELELGATANYPKWSTQDLQEINWSNKLVQFPLPDSVNINSALNDSEESKLPVNSCEDSLSKIKFIWHSPKDKKIYTTGSSPPNSRNKEISSSLTFPESWHDKSLQETNYLQTEISSLRSDLTIPKGPWNSELSEERKLSQSLKPGDSIDDVASRWQLQWEVDQEADEILGGLLPPSPLKSSPPYEIPPKNSGNQADIELNFLDFLESQDQQPPIEDLDNLEPNWVFNEGFAWGASSEEILQTDDDEGGREVLIYENEDGQTVLLPVEYLEDSLYDEIFGSVDTPIGGSLPDLPGGQMNEFKKGSLSLKLSRRARGEKFLPPSKRPCSFFLEGNCRRSDCKFSHDLLTITCRFWVEGSCLKGETCPFRHGFPPPTTRRRNRSEGDQASLAEPVSFASLKEVNSSATANGSRAKAIPKRNRGGNTASVSSFELDSETDFPCLGSSVESKIGSLDETSFGNVKVTKVSKKKKKFITVTKALFNEVENELEKGQSKRGRRSKVSSRSTMIDLSATTLGSEAASSGGDFKKKGKDKECESLRKILRKRYPVPPQPPFSHEDGTLSDF